MEEEPGVERVWARLSALTDQASVARFTQSAICQLSHFVSRKRTHLSMLVPPNEPDTPVSSIETITSVFKKKPTMKQAAVGTGN